LARVQRVKLPLELKVQGQVATDWLTGQVRAMAAGTTSFATVAESAQQAYAIEAQGDLGWMELGDSDNNAVIAALRDGLKPETEIGFHGHHNLSMGVANSIAAIEAGATRIDAAAAGLGAGAGNTPMEVLIAVCERMGIHTGVDLWKIQDVAEDRVVPIMDFPVRIDRDALTLGYAGVYGSFLLFAKRAGEKYGIPARDLLVELGNRRMVGGQEDMIEDTALTMARERGLLNQPVAKAA